VANHFDIVPVRTNDESCIVVRVVVRAQTRRTIVFATRFQSRAMEGFDLPAILGRERQVEMGRLLLGLEHAERSLAVRAELDAVLPLKDNRYAERFECLEEERLARCVVADSEYDVVKHEFSSYRQWRLRYAPAVLGLLRRAGFGPGSGKARAVTWNIRCRSSRSSSSPSSRKYGLAFG